MLDDQDRPSLACQLSEQLGEHLGLMVVETAAGLVEQDQLRVDGQRSGELDESSLPGRQRGDLTISSGLHADPVQKPLRSQVAALVSAGIEASLHVLPGRQGAEELESLEGPSQAKASATVWSELGHVAAAELHLALVWSLQAADDVEECRLAGTVGADQSGHLAGPDVEGHLRQGRHTSEGDRDTPDRKKGRTVVINEHR